MQNQSQTRLLLLIFTLLLSPVALRAADPTVGWHGSSPGAFEGYTLVQRLGGTTIYLVDDAGRVVNSWTSSFQSGLAAYLLDDGGLLRAGRTPGPLAISAGGVGGLFERFDWEGNVTWRFDYSSSTVQHHHDIEPLPNGNVLVLAWELKTEAEAIAAGRNPNTINQGAIWPEHIIEVSQTGPTSGQIVWEWHLWDHLVQDFDPQQANFGVVAEHPERLDINARQNAQADWIHANSIDYNAALDQIVISAHHLDEIWVIDHSTTTAEAAGSTGGNSGRGGDILYRWGNPQNYDAGTNADQRLWVQHCAEWVPEGFPGAGNITIFSNGTGRPGGNFSTIEEITPPIELDGTYTLPPPGTPFGPAATTWTYAAPNPTDFYSAIISGVRRLPNGNTIICEGTSGNLFEVDSNDQTVWQYVAPFAGNSFVNQGSQPGQNSMFRTNRYPASHPGLVGRTLTPGAPLENYPTLGDFDIDGDIDAADLARFELLFTGPVATTIGVAFANAEGFFGDFDLDGDIDCDDALAFESVWTSATPFPGVTACEGSDPEFVRGDVNLDNALDVADPIGALAFLFSGGLLSCELAADANDDGSLDISDPITLLDLLFGSGSSLPAPSVCGADPTPDGLECLQPICP